MGMQRIEEDYIDKMRIFFLDYFDKFRINLAVSLFEIGRI